MKILSTVIALLMGLSASFEVNALHSQLKIVNNSDRVFLTHCVHYEPLSGKWEKDNIDYNIKYRKDEHQSTGDIIMDGEAYFSCEAYANKTNSHSNNAPLNGLPSYHGDMQLDEKSLFPTDNAYLGGDYTYEAVITNLGNDQHTVEIKLPKDLPSGITIVPDKATPQITGNCWDGVTGVILPAQAHCNLKLQLKITKSNLAVKKNWKIALGQDRVTKRLSINSLDNHGSQQVAMLEIHFENDEPILVNWLPFDRGNSTTLDVPQILATAIKLDNGVLTLVDNL